MPKASSVNLGLGLSLCLAAAVVRAQPATTVVELFTSEGCSACPPAEATLGKLAQRQDVIALAFHVDYWDSIGWRDRYELKEAAQRQREYARALHLPSVYTPQMVIDGSRDLLGGGNAALVMMPAAIEGTHARVAVDIALRGDQLIVQLGANSAEPQLASRPDDVLLVSYLPEAVSKPDRGENAGQELREFNVVRSIRQLGTWNGAASAYTIPLSVLPADATRVAVLVQIANHGAIVGAAARPVR